MKRENKWINDRKIKQNNTKKNKIKLKLKN